MSILKRPEEIMMAVLLAVYAVLTYMAAAYLLEARTETALLVALLTLVVLLPAFLLWQRNRAAWLWPCLLGLLAACWWPYFDGLAVKDTAVPLTGLHDAATVDLPWYATWTFKLLLAAMPIAGGYACLLYRRFYRRKEP